MLPCGKATEVPITYLSRLPRCNNNRSTDHEYNSEVIDVFCMIK